MQDFASSKKKKVQDLLSRKDVARKVSICYIKVFLLCLKLINSTLGEIKFGYITPVDKNGYYYQLFLLKPLVEKQNRFFLKLARILKTRI